MTPICLNFLDIFGYARQFHFDCSGANSASFRFKRMPGGGRRNVRKWYENQRENRPPKTANLEPKWYRN